MDMVTLADAPALPAAAGQELPSAQIVVAKLGDYSDRRYGKFGITSGHVADWKRNLAKLPGGQAPIDFDHGPEKGQGSKAGGWITTLAIKTGAQLKTEDPARFGRLADDREYAAANVDFSKAGAESIRNKEYRLISPTFTDHYRDEYGTDHGRALIGAALTNRPALKRDMPVISLSDDVVVLGLEEVSDSRERMPDLAPIAKALRLDADASEATILSHLGDVVILSADDHAALSARAQKGDEAVEQLSTDRFDTAFTKALDANAIAPAEKDDLKALYDASDESADHVIKLIDARVAAGVAVVPGKPAGDGRSTAGAGDLTDGTDVESRQAIDNRVRTLMAGDKDLTYLDALDRVEDELADTAREA